MKVYFGGKFKNCVSVFFKWFHRRCLGESVQNIDVSHLKIADNRKLKFKFMVLDRFINFSRDSNPGHFLGLRLPLTEKHDGILSGSEAPYTWELNDRSEPARFYYTETSTLGIIVTVAFCSKEKF